LLIGSNLTEPGIRLAGHDLQGLLQRRVGGQELHLGPGDQHLADLPLARVEHLAHDVPLVGAQRLVAGHQVAQLLLGHHPAPGRRVTAEEPDHQVDGPRQQPHQRARQHRDPVQGGRGEHRRLLGPLQGQALGGQFAEHQGEVGDRHGDDDQ
jgi:hypothetical protein